MIELFAVYAVLLWYGIWWPFLVITLPLNIVQAYLNKKKTGQYFAKLQYVNRGER